MKTKILMAIAILIWAGCDTPSEYSDLASESQDAVATVLQLPARVIDYSGLADASIQVLDDPDLLLSANNELFPNENATLGRVLFYEKALSQNGSVSCASCHVQSQGFADNRQFSAGFEGALTARNSMSVANVRFYRSGRMFWDERAASLQEQALIPIAHPGEMGLPLEQAVARIDSLPYYDALFTQAFGDERVTTQRIARAIAQFERSIVTTNSKYDRFLAEQRENVTAQQGNQGGILPPNQSGGRAGGQDGQGGVLPPNQGGGRAGGQGGQGGILPPNQGGGRAGGQGGQGDILPPNSGNGAPIQFTSQVLTPQEDLGRRLFFSRRTQCSTCHRGKTFTGDIPRNNGLDIDSADDEGAGEGRFKMASLRNIDLTAPYMHDGRFQSLREVVEHYNSGIQAHPNLDNRLRDRQGRPIRMNLSNTDIDALVAFMRTLTDETLATDDRFSNPFIQ